MIQKSCFYLQEQTWETSFEGNTFMSLPPLFCFACHSGGWGDPRFQKSSRKYFANGGLSKIITGFWKACLYNSTVWFLKTNKQALNCFVGYFKNVNGILRAQSAWKEKRAVFTKICWGWGGGEVASHLLSRPIFKNPRVISFKTLVCETKQATLFGNGGRW